MIRAVIVIAAVGILAGCQSWQSRAPFAQKLSLSEGTNSAAISTDVVTASADCAVRGEDRKCLPLEF